MKKWNRFCIQLFLICIGVLSLVSQAGASEDSESLAVSDEEKQNQLARKSDETFDFPGIRFIVKDMLDDSFSERSVPIKPLIEKICEKKQLPFCQSSEFNVWKNGAPLDMGNGDEFFLDDDIVLVSKDFFAPPIFAQVNAPSVIGEAIEITVAIYSSVTQRVEPSVNDDITINNELFQTDSEGKIFLRSPSEAGPFQLHIEKEGAIPQIIASELLEETPDEFGKTVFDEERNGDFSKEILAAKSFLETVNIPIEQRAWVSLALRRQEDFPIDKHSTPGDIAKSIIVSRAFGLQTIDLEQQLLKFFSPNMDAEKHLYDMLLALIALKASTWPHDEIKQLWTEEILRSQRDDGGFGLGEKSSVWLTSLAAQGMADDMPAQNLTQSLTFIRQSQNDDGGFGSRPGDASDVFSTIYAIMGLGDSSGSFTSDPFSYLIRNQQDDGGFPYKKGLQSDPELTAFAIFALEKNSLPILFLDPNETIESFPLIQRIEEKSSESEFPLTDPPQTLFRDEFFSNEPDVLGISDEFQSPEQDENFLPDSTDQEFLTSDAARDMDPFEEPPRFEIPLNVRENEIPLSDMVFEPDAEDLESDVSEQQTQSENQTEIDLEISDDQNIIAEISRDQQKGQSQPSPKAMDLPFIDPLVLGLSLVVVVSGIIIASSFLKL